MRTTSNRFNIIKRSENTSDFTEKTKQSENRRDKWQQTANCTQKKGATISSETCLGNEDKKKNLMFARGKPEKKN